MAGTTEESLALFGLDDGLSDAARAAVAGPRPARSSPLASTGYAPGSAKSPAGAPARPPGPPPFPPLSEEPGQGVEQEVATVAVPREELEAARKQAQAQPQPASHDELEEEESTRAVSRDELLRGQDAHVIVGEDGEGAAGGEDATLAVSPGDNAANSKHLAALAETLGPSDGGFPPPLGAFPAPFHNPNAPPSGPMGQMPMGGPMGQMPMGPGMGEPPPGWNPGQQQQWNPNAPGSHQAPPNMPMMQGQMGPGHGSNPHMPVANPHVPGSNPHMQASNQQMPGSNPHMQAANPHMPGSNPHMPAYHAQNAPTNMNMGPAMQGMQPYPGQYPGMRPSLQQTVYQPGKRKLSGQILLLAIVGVICLAIFITGIVLFATTKF